MKAFIDTSSLVKKYIAEAGSNELDDFLGKVSEITVSPTCWLELNSTIARRLKEKTLTSTQAHWLKTEARKDFDYFRQVLWNENLEQKAVELIQKHHLKTLDSLQLASAFISKCDVFVASDRKLLNAAKKILTDVEAI